jgi:hypothetical protein
VQNVRAAGVLHRTSVALVLLFTGACDSARARAPEQAQADADSIARALQDSVNRTLPGYVVDSVHTVEEELRRFRQALGGEPATGLAGGSDSRDGLVERFVAALEASDTSEFQAMAVSAREFADLVYPTSPYTRPPYRQSIAFVWFQTQNANSVGLTRLLNRRGGRALGFAGYTCPGEPEIQGANRIWTGCTLQAWNDDGSPREEQLFGAIVERQGRYKFLSYANRL